MFPSSFVFKALARTESKPRGIRGGKNVLPREKTGACAAGTRRFHPSIDQKRADRLALFSMESTPDQLSHFAGARSLDRRNPEGWPGWVCQRRRQRFPV